MIDSVTNGIYKNHKLTYTTDIRVRIPLVNYSVKVSIEGVAREIAELVQLCVALCFPVQSILSVSIAR